MEWTQEVPTSRGRYWVKATADATPDLYEMVPGFDGVRAVERYMEPFDAGAWFYGPLKAPPFTSRERDLEAMFKELVPLWFEQMLAEKGIAIDHDKIDEFCRNFKVVT